MNDTPKYHQYGTVNSNLSKSLRGFSIVFRVFFAFAVVASLLHVCTAVVAQSDESQDNSWWAVVIADNVRVRCGHAAEYYEIDRLEIGTLVKVKKVNGRSGWASIEPTAEVYGLVKVKDVTLEGDETSGVVESGTIGKFVAYEADQIPFKRFTLPPKTPVSIVDEQENEGEPHFVIIMPKTVPAAMHSRFLRPASDAEILAWEKRANEEELPEDEGDTSTPANTDPLSHTLTEDPIEEDVYETTETTLIVETPVIEEIAIPAGNDDLTDAVATDTNEETADQDAVPVTAESELTANVTTQETHETPVIEEPTDAPSLELPESSPEDTETSDDDSPATKLTQPELLDVLNDRFHAIKKVPILEAEIEPLLRAFATFAADPDISDSSLRLVQTRMQLLEIRLKHQKARQRMASALADATQTYDHTQAMANENASSEQWDYVGLLKRSSVFNGVDLPVLYRIQDPVTGRTLVYVAPTKTYTLDSLVDHTVGVIGDSILLPRLRVEVVKPLKVSKVQ